ncbi:MAG: hypothetical protein IPJ05_10505 [Nitrosomonas sp.]|nr:hypothetical protein [Nitrosomonas sp.]
MVGMRRLTPRLTGAGARSAEGTNTGHENAEGMASVGVRVEPPVRHLISAPRLASDMK